MHSYTYLALGDSYTIGEALPLHLSFPYQTVARLRKEGLAFMAPEIVARTGWTADELSAAIAGHNFLPRYDFVSLLIGVNNQYRGRPILEFKVQLEGLIKKAIAFAGDRPDHTTLLSIPDYSLTPFGREKEPEKISREIAQYNTLVKALATQYKVWYLPLPESNADRLHAPPLLAEDGLHPAAEAYAEWARLLAARLKACCKK